MSVSRDFIDFVLPQAPALIAAKPPRAVTKHLPKNSLLLPYLAVAPLPHKSPGVRHGKSRLHAHHLDLWRVHCPRVGRRRRQLRGCASGHTTVAPPSSVMNSRRLIPNTVDRFAARSGG